MAVLSQMSDQYSQLRQKSGLFVGLMRPLEYIFNKFSAKTDPIKVVPQHWEYGPDGIRYDPVKYPNGTSYQHQFNPNYQQQNYGGGLGF
jgi:hypothetical protein